MSHSFYSTSSKGLRLRAMRTAIGVALALVVCRGARVHHAARDGRRRARCASTSPAAAHVGGRLPPSRGEAIRMAQSTACAVLSDGVTQGMQCQRTPPRSAQCDRRSPRGPSSRAARADRLPRSRAAHDGAQGERRARTDSGRSMASPRAASTAYYSNAADGLRWRAMRTAIGDTPRAVLWLALGAAAGIGCAALGLLLSGERDRALPANAAASVNGAVIRLEEYDRAVAAFASDRRDPIGPEERRHVLDRMLDEELLVQRGLELGLARSDRRVRGDIVSAVIELVVSQADGVEPSDGEVRAFYEREPRLLRAHRAAARAAGVRARRAAALGGGGARARRAGGAAAARGRAVRPRARGARRFRGRAGAARPAADREAARVPRARPPRAPRRRSTWAARAIRSARRAATTCSCCSIARPASRRRSPTCRRRSAPSCAAARASARCAPISTICASAPTCACAATDAVRRAALARARAGARRGGAGRRAHAQRLLLELAARRVGRHGAGAHLAARALAARVRSRARRRQPADPPRSISPTTSRCARETRAAPPRGPVAAEPAPKGWAHFRWRIACTASGPRSLESRVLLDVAPSHLHFARVAGDGAAVRERVLTEAEPVWALETARGAGPAAAAGTTLARLRRARRRPHRHRLGPPRVPARAAPARAPPARGGGARHRVHGRAQRDARRSRCWAWCGRTAPRSRR